MKQTNKQKKNEGKFEDYKEMFNDSGFPLNFSREEPWLLLNVYHDLGVQGATCPNCLHRQLGDIQTSAGRKLSGGAGDIDMACTDCP